VTENFWFPSSPSPNEMYFEAILSDNFGEGDFSHGIITSWTWQFNHEFVSLMHSG